MSIKVFYNEIDQFACAWLSNLMDKDLIRPGTISDKSIVDLTPDDVKPYELAHFFAGIAGWDHALTLANWKFDGRVLWTGSCPCQPFSAAGQGRGFEDPRHLWPELSRLIGQCRPATLFGEQVAGATQWLGVVRSDLETMGYAVGAMPIEAASVGARHKRDRLWFVAKEMADSQRVRRDHPHQYQSGSKRTATMSRGTRRLASKIDRSLGKGNWWDTEPRVARVANGLPKPVGKVRALGNAIVPQVAATFIKATMSCE